MSNLAYVMRLLTHDSDASVTEQPINTAKPIPEQPAIVNNSLIDLPDGCSTPQNTIPHPIAPIDL